MFKRFIQMLFVITPAPSEYTGRFYLAALSRKADYIKMELNYV